MSNKEFGTSRGAGQVGNRLAGRYAETTEATAEQPAPPAPPRRTAPKMVTRSWYLPAETAEHLAGTADRLWRELPGTSKHEVLAALIEAGLNQTDEVRQHLSQSSQP